MITKTFIIHHSTVYYILRKVGGHSADCWVLTAIGIVGSGGHLKNAYELLNLSALKISTLYKNCIFQLYG